MRDALVYTFALIAGSSSLLAIDLDIDERPKTGLCAVSPDDGGIVTLGSGGFGRIDQSLVDVSVDGDACYLGAGEPVKFTLVDYDKIQSAAEAHGFELNR